MANKKIKKNEEGVRTSVKVMAIILILMMATSILGFVFMLSPFALSGSSDSNQNLPSNLPLQQFEQEGVVFWAGIKNDEIFQFETIEGFDEREDLNLLVQELEQKDSIQLLIDPEFTNSNVLFMLEQKIPAALELTVSRASPETQCSPSVLAVTYNENIENYDGCLIFAPSRDDENREVEILSYHIVN